MELSSGDGEGVAALSATGYLHFSAQYVCHLLNVSILQQGTFQFEAATISRLQMEYLFGAKRCDEYYRWLPGAASHFQAIIKNFCTSVKIPRRSEVLATQPSPLFHVVSGGHIVTNVSVFGSVEGELAMHTDMTVYMLPSSARVSEPSLVFMPSEWLFNHTVKQSFVDAIRATVT